MFKKSFFFIIFSYFLTNAQNHQLQAVDSLIAKTINQKQDTLLANNLNLISKNYIYQNSDKGIEFAKKALIVSEKLSWKCGMGEAHFNLGMHSISKGNYHNAQEEFDIANKIFYETKNKLYIAKVYNGLGILKANQSKYVESLDYFYKSLQLFESLKNSSVQINIGSCYENIGTINNINNNYDNAIYNYKRAIQILRKIKNKEVEVAINYANIGTIYQKKKELKKALNNYLLSEKELANFNDNFALAFINSSLGSIYLAMNNYELSIVKSNKALSFLKFIKDKDLICTTTQNLGYAEFKKGKSIRNIFSIKNGFEKIVLSLNLYKELGNQEGIMKGYLYISEYYSYTKSFENSLKNYQLYTTYKDSIFNTKNRQSLKNLEDQRTISIRNKQIQLNKLSLANKEKQKWFFIIGLFLLTIIGTLLYYQSNNRKKVNEKLSYLNKELDDSNKAKTRFFSILNHDLRGPVANLISFLQLQKESPEMLDEESTKRMQDKTMTGAENLLNAMEDILQWSKSQMENFKPQLKKVSIDSLFSDIKIHFASDESIKITFENLDNLELETDANYLKTILRNLTANAIKALSEIENPTIVWKAYKINSQKFLSISDNGFGASQEQFKALYDDKEVVGIQSGLGLHLIRDLAKAINCEINVESKTEIGTKFILKMS